MLSRRFPHSISSAGGSMAPPDDIDDYEPWEEDDEPKLKVCHHGIDIDLECYDCEQEYIVSNHKGSPEEAA